MNRLAIIHYSRKPRHSGNFSLEAIFSDVRRRLEHELEISVHVAPTFSNGLLPRLRIMFDVWKHRREPLHFTGDIHFAAIAASKTNSILTIHDCSGLVHQKGLRAFLLKMFWFTIPTRRVARVTTVSESTKRDIIAITGCPPGKIAVIPNAVSDQFLPKPKPFNAHCPVILQIGTAFNKNIERLALALATIRCRLVVVGQLNSSQATSLESSGVEFVNLINLTDDAILSQYEQCDIVAFASTFEGFGLPIIEAQRVGRPVVTSQCSSMPEVAGQGACFVDPMSVESIRRGFQRIIEDTDFRERIVKAGYKNAERFDAERVARQYLEVYREVFVDSRP